ncbi:hypothetical protein LSCM1_02926 [Leishmania martiniquensis]|uniref:EngB-type G domain-containing protein n=1 Tax=Leishmania martiniquensis TaxID=1580590 RepID=A0A836GU29_9TRYP|nr:hypothetical protein LSCM1_02926 [Leishmania martiniquensis]
MSCRALRRTRWSVVRRTSAALLVPVRGLTSSARAAASLAPTDACRGARHRRRAQPRRRTPFTELERSTWGSSGEHGQLDSLHTSGEDRQDADAAAASPSRHPTVGGSSRGAAHMSEGTRSASCSGPGQGGLLAQRERRPRQRRPSSVLMELPEAGEATATASSSLAPLPAGSVRWSLDGHMADVQDDDVVLDTPASLLPCMATRGAPTSELQKAGQRAHRQRRGGGSTDAAPEKSEHAHPAARGVGQDVIDLVTDVFRAQREAEIQRRREVLYELTHPKPIDYTYSGKLVPPPPLSFGQVTEEARSLGNKLMLGQTYSLVRQAGTRASDDDFDVLGDRAGTAGRGTATATTVSPASCIETGVATPHSAFSPRRAKGCGVGAAASPYRSRARDTNIFRDHNYFFEIDELYQEVVLVGRACAGKSSLLNALLGQHVAKTSSMPNTTRKISFYQSVTPEQLRAFLAKEQRSQLVKLPGGGLQLTFVDLPGYGIEGMSDKWRDAAIELTDAYFGVRRSVNTVLYCMDCERGLTKTDIKYLEWIENVHGTCFMVLTKCDSVPHSRVCSVMRQVYALITKHRRKYRKVFPFIMPVSAKDGTNIEQLRGLITETSGIIPGDKLRDLLQRKRAATTHTALLEEANRIDAARQLERSQAQAYFHLTRGGTDASAAATLPVGAQSRERPSASREREGGGGAREGGPVPSAEEGAAAPPGFGPGGGHRRYVLPLGDSGAADFFPSKSSMEGAGAGGRRERRERFPAWRRTHPLSTASPSHGAIDGPSGCDATPPLVGPWREAGSPGSGRYRLNTGLDNPAGAHAVVEVHGESDVSEVECDARGRGGEAARHGGGDSRTRNRSGPLVAAAGASSPSLPTELRVAAVCHGRRTSVIGAGDAGADGSVGSGTAASAAPSAVRPTAAGTVSRFLDVMELYGRQYNVVSSAKQRRRERLWSRRGGCGGAGGRRCAVGGLLAEDACGRLSAYRAGRPCGPTLVSTSTDVRRRQAEWRAEQLKALLAKANPEAPWAALHELRRRIEAREEAAALAGMGRKEVAAYVRNAGRVTASFEKFEGEVAAAKYMNEIRQAPTLRSQQQMHLNATAKINYRSMPPGLWKRYGGRDVYWPTPQVLGRPEDESHT